MGSITHKILEKAWSDKEAADKLVQSLSEKEGLGEVEKNSIQHFVSTYFERFRIMVADEDKIEKRFKVKLYDDVFLVGVFDRISKGVVIDWKTNSKPPKYLYNNVQFILYDLAYNLLYNKKPEGLYLAALKDGSLVRYSESKEHSDTIINKIIPEFVHAVRNRLFIKTGLFSGACYRCQYKQTCISGDKDVVDNPSIIEE